MFRGANMELKNSTGHMPYQVAVSAGYHNLADAIQRFRSDEVGENLALLSLKSEHWTTQYSYFVVEKQEGLKQCVFSRVGWQVTL